MFLEPQKYALTYSVPPTTNVGSHIVTDQPRDSSTILAHLYEYLSVSLSPRNM